MALTVEASCNANTQSTSGNTGTMAVSAGSRLFLFHVQADAVGQPTLTFKWNTNESFTQLIDYDPQTPWNTGSVQGWYLNNPTAGTFAVAYTNAGPTSRGHFYCISITGLGTFPRCVRSEGGNNVENSGSINVALSAIATDLVFAVMGKNDTVEATTPWAGSTELGDIAIVDGRADWAYKISADNPGFSDPATTSERSMYAVALGNIPTGPGATWFWSKLQDFYDELKRGLIPPMDLQKRYREVYSI